MVAGLRIEGGTQIISPRVRKTIQSIKEIVGNHSDADIYVALKDTNMDPNETAQKLLNQDPFHEVKRRRDKKKEVTGYRGSISVEPRKPAEQVGQGVKFNTFSDRDRNTYYDRDRSTYSDRDRNVRRGGYSRNTVPDAGGVTREFRVVKDNRITQIADKEIKPHRSFGSFRPSFQCIPVLGFGEYIEDVYAAYEQHKLETMPDTSRGVKCTNGAEMTEEEALAEQQMMFAEARARMNGGTITASITKQQPPEAEPSLNI